MSSSRQKDLLLSTAVDVFVEAVEATLHVILCARNIYPKAIFGTFFWTTWCIVLPYFMAWLLFVFKVS